MLIEAAVAVAVLESFLCSIAEEGSKQLLRKIWSDDNDLQDLQAQLHESLPELKNAVTSITASLNNASPVSHLDLPSDWLDKVEQCRYDIEDMEDSRDSKLKANTTKKFLASKLHVVREMQTHLRKIEEEIERGLSERKQCNSVQSPEHEWQAFESESRIREEDRGKIIEELFKPSPPGGVSIIGIGGTGKTILARDIAGESRIKQHFPCVLQPQLSSDFSRDKAISSVKNAPRDRRALIVLDGLHSVREEDWRNFQIHCRNLLHRESKVLITTQNPRVADVTGTSKHYLSPLSEGACFDLIKKFAAANNNLSEDDAEAISLYKEELVDTCKGLPPLAKQIGLLLSAVEQGHRPNTIRAITNTSSWKVPGLQRVLVNLNRVLALVRRPQLRRCLAYCSLFPQDYEFQEENLVQLWTVEGFTPLTKDATYLEKTTREYFEELLCCSVFQPSAMPPGDNPSYKMHGLAYDMAQNVASNAFCRKLVGIPSISNSQISELTRHFSLNVVCDTRDDQDIINAFLREIQERCSKLRSFLMFNEAGKKINKNPTFFQSLTLLRVLDLSYTNLTRLDPKHISKYLRYLDLSHTPVETLPKLSRIPQLQVLKLNHCDHLLHLPKDLTKLTSLISLQVNMSGLGSMPSGIGKLANLQWLDLFVVGKKEGFKIAELKILNHLRKPLRITKLENVETELEAQEANLIDKTNLEKLELEWSSSAPNETAKQVLEGLQPPKGLKELVIRNYPSAEFPEWLSNSRVCRLLESVHLDRCRVTPSLDHLERLKTLRVDAMHDVIGINGQGRGFSRIETLVLCDMRQVNQWIELAANYMPGLRNVRVDQCQELLTLPELSLLTSVQKLEISRCSQMKELPTLPPSLKFLYIKHSCDVLRARCQDGGDDRPKLRCVHVEIDSVLLHTSDLLHPATPAHQTSSVQDDNLQGTTNGDQQASPSVTHLITNHNGDSQGTTSGDQQASPTATHQVANRNGDSQGTTKGDKQASPTATHQIANHNDDSQQVTNGDQQASPTATHQIAKDNGDCQGTTNGDQPASPTATYQIASHNGDSHGTTNRDQQALPTATHQTIDHNSDSQWTTNGVQQVSPTVTHEIANHNGDSQVTTNGDRQASPTTTHQIASPNSQGTINGDRQASPTTTHQIASQNGDSQGTTNGDQQVSPTTTH